VSLIARRRDARQVNRAWRPEEVKAVLEAAPQALRVPIALGLYTGLREGDVIRITWSAYDGTAFETRQGKTGNAIWMQAHRDLRIILDAITPRMSPLIVIGTRGRLFTENGFQSRFFKFVRAIEKEGRVGKGSPSTGCVTAWGKCSPTPAATPARSPMSSATRRWRSRSTTARRLTRGAGRRRQSGS
jgi:integrase